MKFRLSATVLGLFFTVAVLSSCTREYTCTCDISYKGQPGLPEPSTKDYTIRDTKTKAKSVCEGNSDSSQTGGITTVEKCHLY